MNLMVDPQPTSRRPASGAAVFLFAAMFGCASDPGPVPTGGAGAVTAADGAPGSGAGGMPSSGTGGSSAGTGGAATGGVGSDGGAQGGAAGTGGSQGRLDGGLADGSMNRDAGLDKPRYECTLILGFNVTGDWFRAGFENIVDGNRWEVKGVHQGVIENYADPSHAVWRETNCDGNFSPCTTASVCAAGNKPDRVVFVTDILNGWETATQQVWEQGLNAAMSTVRVKYPAVKHIDLTTFPRSPTGQKCGSRADIPAAHDAAHQAVAAASGGTVSVTPPFSMMSCAQFAGPPYLTAEGNMYMARQLGEYYAAQEK